MGGEPVDTTCCVVGGGPAGIMLGYLLARAGVDVTVLEQHTDFFRDFRGDTVHPATLELMHELGLLEDLLRIPHQKITSVRGRIGEDFIEIANMASLKARCPYVALMPQWDFLNFLAERGRAYRGFDLRMDQQAVDLIHEKDRIRGLVVHTPRGTELISARLVIACDGRHSTLRSAAHLELREYGVPIDVLWFRLSRDENDREQQLMGNINYGKVLVLFSRGDYYQAGLIIRKDSFEQIKRDGLDAFRATIARINPQLQSRMGELQDWDQIKLLSVRINRLRRWHRPGLLCIGDAAHAMSPAFGVGINLAIQDAVAAANLLSVALKDGRETDGLLDLVQRRREFPTRVIQFMQLLAHKGLDYVFRQTGPMHAPRPVKLALGIPGIQHFMARAIGIGIRPEHVARQFRRTAPKLGPARKIVGICAAISAAATVAWRGFRTNP